MCVTGYAWYIWRHMCGLFCRALLQKRPTIWRSLLFVATQVTYDLTYVYMCHRIRVIYMTSYVWHDACHDESWRICTWVLACVMPHVWRHIYFTSECVGCEKVFAGVCRVSEKLMYSREMNTKEMTFESCVKSHIWRHICHAYPVTHIRVCQVTHIHVFYVTRTRESWHVSRHTYDVLYVTRILSHIYAYVMSHIYARHDTHMCVTHIRVSWHTYTCIMAHIYVRIY